MSWKRVNKEDWTPGGGKAIVLVIAENKYQMEGQPHIVKLLADHVNIEVTETMVDDFEDKVYSRHTNISVAGAGKPEKFRIDIDPMVFKAQSKRKQSWDIKKAMKMVLEYGKIKDKRVGMRVIRLSDDKKDKMDREP